MILGTLVISLSMLLSVAGLFLVERLVPLTLRQEHNDVAGFIYAVVGVAYAVLLAFMVIAVWEDYETARNTVDHEAGELAEIYRLTDQFPEPERSEIQEHARSYARVVIEEEWPMMQDGRASDRAWAVMNDVGREIAKFKPSTSAEQVLYGQALTQAHDLEDARRLRLLEANEGIPSILWVVLLIGGGITVTFTYLFGLENSWAHRLMIMALTAMIALILFTTYSLDYPFSRGVRLGPDAFEAVLQGLTKSA